MTIIYINFIWQIHFVQFEATIFNWCLV